MVNGAASAKERDDDGGDDGGSDEVETESGIVVLVRVEVGAGILVASRRPRSDGSLYELHVH